MIRYLDEVNFRRRFIVSEGEEHDRQVSRHVLELTSQDPTIRQIDSVLKPQCDAPPLKRSCHLIPPQAVGPAEDQGFKYVNLWGPLSFKLAHSTP